MDKKVGYIVDLPYPSEVLLSTVIGPERQSFTITRLVEFLLLLAIRRDEYAGDRHKSVSKMAARFNGIFSSG